MKITVSPENTKLTVAETFAATEFFIKLLLPKKKRKKLLIDISFCDEDAVPRWNGSCLEITKRKYDIWIRRSKSHHDQLNALAHELVHVKQFVQNEMCPWTFKIKSAGLRGMSIQSNDSYWDNPAEIEAFGRSIGMVSRYFTEINNKQQS